MAGRAPPGNGKYARATTRGRTIEYRQKSKAMMDIDDGDGKITQREFITFERVIDGGDPVTINRFTTTFETNFSAMQAHGSVVTEGTNP